MRTELDYHTFEQLIIRNNAELGFEIIYIYREKTSHHQKSIVDQQLMMSNRLLEGGREPMKQKEGSTMKKLSQNT